MEVPMELSRILITELGDQQVIFLKEKSGKRTFPILIGINEALAIDRRLKDKPTPRPMTHDLLASVISAMGGKLDRIVISDLHEHTFIATLFISRGAETIEVDSRPSYAIALGAAFDTPIFVAEHVLEQVTREPKTVAERLALLRERREALSAQMAELSGKLSDETFLAGTTIEAIKHLHEHMAEMQAEYEAIDGVLKKLG